MMNTQNDNNGNSNSNNGTAANTDHIPDPLGYPWYLNQDMDGVWDPEGAPARVAEWHARRDKERQIWNGLEPSLRRALLRTWIKYGGHVQDMPMDGRYRLLTGLRRYMPTVEHRARRIARREIR